VIWLAIFLQYALLGSGAKGSWEPKGMVALTFWDQFQHFKFGGRGFWLWSTILKNLLSCLVVTTLSHANNAQFWLFFFLELFTILLIAFFDPFIIPMERMFALIAAFVNICVFCVPLVTDSMALDQSYAGRIMIFGHLVAVFLQLFIQLRPVLYAIGSGLFGACCSKKRAKVGVVDEEPAMILS
jgi:hypothetical protein